MQKHLAISDNFKDLIGETEKNESRDPLRGCLRVTSRGKFRTNNLIISFSFFLENYFRFEVKTNPFQGFQVSIEHRDVINQPAIFTKRKNEHTEE